MPMPGFSADASLGVPRAQYHGVAGRSQVQAGTIVPQFCYCECWLQRICFPFGGVGHCYYVPRCIAHGNCPPGYCGGF
jgi:hypothetical protein